MLVLHGEKGSTKTTLQTLIKLLDHAEEAYELMMSGKARFRSVLTTRN